MIKIQFLPVYVLAVMVLVGMKLFFSQAALTDVQFIIAPTSYLVSLCSGLPFHFELGEGYYNVTNQVLIDKSCAGTNFFVIAFGMSLLSSIPHYPTITKQVQLFIALLIASFLFTLFANTSRISIAIFLLQSGIELPWFSATDWHTLQGSFVYLSVLIAYYSLLQFIHSKTTTRHAQFA